MLLVATVVLGLVYPLAVWGVSRLPGLNGPAEGSVVTAPTARRSGSSLIGIDPVAADAAPTRTSTPAPRRPREDVLGPGDPSTSGGSNQGGFSDKLLGQVEQRRAAIAAREGVAPEAVPADAVTASAPASTRTSARRTPTCRSPGSPGSPACREPGPRARRATPPTAARWASWASRGERHPAEPGHRRGARPAREPGSAVDGWTAPWRRAASCGSTWARRPGSARPTPCSARPTAAPSAGPTSSSGWSRPTGGPRRPSMIEGLEVVPRRTVVLPRRRADRAGRRRRARPQPRRSCWSTSSPTPTPRARGTPSAGRTSRTCSRPGSPC